MTARDGRFVEVADRCWVARYELLDVNVSVVGGERGLLVVDTHASEVEARAVVEVVRRLGAGDVVAVVNTHQHFDHSFGNIVFSEEYAGPPTFAHEAAAAAMTETAPTLQADAAAYAEDPEVPDRQRHRDIADTRVLVPDHTFSSARSVDLGDRVVELIHPGRGHTGGDAIVRVPDADVMFAGDLVEESQERYPEWGTGVPGFGDDCFPLEWPATLDLMVSLLSDATVVVPGHGAPVTRAFVNEQRDSVGIVAETIRQLAGQGMPVADALRTGEWPYPVQELGHAVRRGYDHLPRGARSLPML